MPEATDGTKQDSGAPRRRVAIWDLPTRLFHWLLAALVCAAWITGQLDKLDIHMWIGEAILALIIFRIAWGLVGSRHSRFRDFLAGPRTVWIHIREMIDVLRRGPAGSHKHAGQGHTALGGWMILLMLLVLLAQTGAGLFATDDIVTDGPLNHLVASRTGKLLSSIHSIGGTVILIMGLVHVAVALFYLWRKRENLILPMITGRKNIPADMAGDEGRFASPWLALALFIVALALVRAIISL